MKIIITAAGKGKRFKEIGIKEEKYQITVKNKSLLYWSLISLKNLFNYEFIFIFQKKNYKKDFVERELKKIGINHFRIILINHLTKGQAATAMIAEPYIDKNEETIIFNIDTHLNPKMIKKEIFNSDGVIVTTKAKGDQWSFAKTKNKSNKVIEVSEKKRISTNASVGLYYFKFWSDFINAYKKVSKNVKKQYKEIYINPLYQYLIDQDKDITIHGIPLKCLNCLGTPKEVKKFDPDWDI